MGAVAITESVLQESALRERTVRTERERVRTEILMERLIER